MFFQPVGNLKQSLGLYLSDGLIEILAGFAVERAEQFAVPVDEKFINGRTFITAVSVKSGIVDHHYRGGFILR